MRVSTKVRLYYIAFFVLLLTGGFLILRFGQAALPIAFIIGPAYLLFGQLLVISKVSSEVCLNCGESLVYKKPGATGFSYIVRLLSSGQCSKCGSAI